MAILFDLDGTLVDSSLGIMSAFSYCFETLNLPIPSDSQLREFIGPPLETTFAAYFEKDDDINKAISLFREYYDTKGVYQSTLYSDVKETLDFLRAHHIPLFITTSKNEPMAYRMLEYLEINHYFTAIYGALPNRYRKSDVIAACLAEHKLATENTVILGDTIFDIFGGKDNSIKTIAASWGFGDRKTLEDSQPDDIIDSIESLKKVVDFN
ncbi:HAD hydrolase-like protein [Streptococcus saliviloxodontae]|uniref:Phosphoglycolate phosphatase n=1 Tax=Streptococcus saliviloxodontae TaxID=1349416 RepID=A0ABS2PK73_9STRE|nr:HAD hydrolase-like protein [Streptococcus saliviloxodontae]MBM7635827.1 phosphoglycolate phosphatase [Streptococcus saliviloxodontae]